MLISDWSSDVCSSDLIWNTPAIFELAARGSNARRDRFANFLRCKGDALARTFYEFLLTIDAAQKTRAIAECGIDRTLWRLDRIITRHRSEERRVGKECVSTCRYRWSPCH